jgi:hypothetical protein
MHRIEVRLADYFRSSVCRSLKEQETRCEFRLGEEAITISISLDKVSSL